MKERRQAPSPQRRGPPQPNCSFYHRCYNKPMRCQFCVRNGNTWRGGIPTYQSDFLIEPPKDV
jgi:hypothetical protein